jgi:hypothetical protein
VFDPTSVKQSGTCRAGKGVDKVKQDLGATLITNYKVWPAVQILNFTVVPLKLQVLLQRVLPPPPRPLLALEPHALSRQALQFPFKSVYLSTACPAPCVVHTAGIDKVSLSIPTSRY